MTDHHMGCLHLVGECDCGFDDHLDQAEEAGVAFTKALHDWRHSTEAMPDLDEEQMARPWLTGVIDFC
jgi:hypothetical protein